MTNATAISRSRVWSVLTTPAAIPQTGPRLKTNLDTDLLKLIAIAAMLIDHIGGLSDALDCLHAMIAQQKKQKQ